MALSSHDATAALRDIEQAEARSATLLDYQYAAPHFLMKSGLLLVALFFALARPVPGEWIATASDSEAASVPGLIHRHLELKNSATDEFAALDLALFPASAKKSLRGDGMVGAPKRPVKRLVRPAPRRAIIFKHAHQLRSF